MSTSASFPVLEDPESHRTDIPAFTVSTTRGFLPRVDPPTALPEEFAVLESLLERMPVKTLSGQPGLLAIYKFGEAVDKELADLTDDVLKYKDNLVLINALYRDYSFVASAYLLEPCHERHVNGEPYGLARDVLPASIARPIAASAEIIGFKPYMEYAGSYALYNYQVVPNTPKELPYPYSSLRLIRAFEHGLDPTSSEAGFVLVHVAMAQHSGALVSASLAALDACAAPFDPQALAEGLRGVAAALKPVNAAMDTMWGRSKPREYASFRTFIFGIASQTMFPNGVLYEGVSDKPLAFRGESGANDSMIPLVDNLLELHMPDTPLTDVLRDFRSYRPGNHRQFLEWVAAASKSRTLLHLASTDTAASKAYLLALDQVREFRWRHWCFTREYILKQSSYGRATGGSPIVTWLPNQLRAVLDGIVQAGGRCGAQVHAPDSDQGDKDHQVKGHDVVVKWRAGVEADAEVERMLELAAAQRASLDNEVAKWCAERGRDSSE